MTKFEKKQKERWRKRQETKKEIEELFKMFSVYDQTRRSMVYSPVGPCSSLRQEGSYK